MKKLMFGAVLATSFAAVAGVCNPEEEVDPIVEPIVYSFKASVKTTKGITNAGYTTTVGKTICNPGDEEEVGAIILRTKDTTKFQGWIYDCEPTCSTIATGSAVVWDSKRKAQLNDAAFDTAFIHVMGKKQGEAEWAWGFSGTAVYGDDALAQTYTLTGAGLGKFSPKKGYYTSFSGNFAGTATASFDLTKKTTCDPSQVWLCEDLETLVDEDTVAYGSWSAKYDATASKKFRKSDYLKVPGYVTYDVQ